MGLTAVSYNAGSGLGRYYLSNVPMIRRLKSFLRTFRKARRLGFTLVDAVRAALVNSRAA
jgi:hypothetical protein